MLSLRPMAVTLLARFVDRFIFYQDEILPVFA